MSHIVDTLLLHIRAVELPEPKCEYRFAAALVGDGKGLRQRLDAAGLHDWRFDLAYPDRKIAIECEGGTWSNGRHTRGKGYEGDCRKYNRAIELGWRVYRFTSGMVDSGEAIQTLQRVMFAQNSW